LAVLLNNHHYIENKVLLIVGDYDLFENAIMLFENMEFKKRF